MLRTASSFVAQPTSILVWYWFQILAHLNGTVWGKQTYRQISNIRYTKFQNWNVSRPVLQLYLPNLLKPGVGVENEDVVGAAPTGDAQTTSEWSTILLPTEVRLILEVPR